MEAVYASTDVTNRNTYEEFEAVVGKAEARRRSGATAESRMGLEPGLLGRLWVLFLLRGP